MSSEWVGLKIVVYLLFIILTFLSFKLIFNHFRLQPSNERMWVNDNARNATAIFDDDSVTISNVREFNWRSTKHYDEKWEEHTYDLTTVTKVWLTLEYFEPKYPGMAHTILSFEFRDGRRIACSIEVRREVGERYHPFRALFRQYELLYVWAIESDVIGVRSRCRKRSTTHLFEAVVLGEGNERKLFESYLKRTNKLSKNPEWYNSLTNTCSTNIMRHVNEIYPRRIPRAFSVLMPGLSPKMLAKKNLVKLNGTLENTLQTSIIDHKASEWDGKSDFGDLIRAFD